MVAILPVTLGRRRGEEVEMWTLVVGVTVAMRGGMSGAILVGRTAAVGVLSPEEMVLLGVLSPKEVLLVGPILPLT